MNLTPATYKVTYNNVNITKDISDHLVSLSYADKVEGESDELEITLEDADLLWQNSWYPAKGARIQAQIEQDGLVLNCGAFTIDEIQLSSDRGSGDTVTIRGLAAGITKKLRTKKSSGHENKTLREIANSIAANNGLTVSGKIEDIPFKRITQYNETDLSFLKRLAGDYGYIFSVRDNLLTFTSIYDLEAHAHVMSIDKTDLLNWSLKDKTAQVFKKAKLKHHSILSNEVIEAAEDFDPGFDTDEELDIHSRVENKQQAEAKTKAALHKKNSVECDGSVSLPGNTLLIAGNNFELTGMGTLSGINHILASTHTIDRGGGYIVSADIKRIKTIPAAKHKPKRVKQKSKGVKTVDPNYDYSWGTSYGQLAPKTY